jgi:hypothetical protein
MFPPNGILIPVGSPSPGGDVSAVAPASFGADADFPHPAVAAASERRTPTLIFEPIPILSRPGLSDGGQYAAYGAP